MTLYGFRSVVCPDCGSPDTTVERFVNPKRQPGPGERAFYRCNECETQFIAVVPEPQSNYEGDGIFAANH